jgi:Protein of unknown function (DUF3168)
MAATTIYGKAREQLLATPAVQALVGTRIYPMRAPQSPTYPLVIYQQISGDHLEGHQGSAGAVKARFQYGSVATDYSKAHQVAEAVRSALQGWRDPAIGIQGTTLVTELDFEDENLGLYRVLADYFIWGTEPVPA